MLVCLDRSPTSEVCVPHAVWLARTFGRDITLVHVMQPPQSHNGSDAIGWEISRHEARAYLDRIEARVSRELGRPAAVRLEQGRPAERIADLAREIGADLTVLASHGEGGAPSWNLGSTAQQVLGLVHGSVFVASASSNPPSTVTPLRILVPLDGSQRGESVLPAAARIASAQGAELLLAHVVHEPQATVMLDAGDDLELAAQLAARLSSSAVRYLERLQQRLANEGASVHTTVCQHVSPRLCLLELAQQERADLIVLSADGSGRDGTRSFGSVITYLLTHSMVPLLVLQDLPETGLERTQELEPKMSPPPLRASYAAERA